jgi:hypothetical protein
MKRFFRFLGKKYFLMALFLIFPGISSAALPPIGNDTTVVIRESASYNFSDNDIPYSDSENDLLAAIKIVSWYGIGDLQYEGNAIEEGAVYTDIDKLAYHPPIHYNGENLAGFSYYLIDSDGDTSVTSYQISLDIYEVNLAPVSRDTTVFMAEDTILFELILYSDDGDPMDNDVDNQALTWHLLTSPLHGMISFGENTQYIPNENFNGSDSIKYYIRDNGTTQGEPDPLSSPIYTVKFIIWPENDHPISGDTTVSLAEDNSININLYGNDGDPMDNESDNQILTWEILTAPLSGVISTFDATTGNLIYQPNLNFNGYDSLVYRICDNGTTNGAPDPLCSELSVVRFNVTPVNDEPELLPISAISIREDSDTAIVLKGTDVDILTNNDVLTFTSSINNLWLAELSVSSIDDSSASLQIVGKPNMHGLTNITVTVSDDSGAVDIKSFQLEIWPENDYPISGDTTVSLAEDNSININLYGNDGDPMDNESDNQILTWEILTAPLSGVISTFDASTGNLIYQPNLNFNGIDSLVYRVCDDGTTNGNSDGHCSEPSVVRFIVTPVNDPPDLFLISDISIREDSDTTIILTGSDVDIITNNDKLSFSASINHQWLADLLIESINDSSAILHIIEKSDMHGLGIITVTVSDDSGAADLKSFQLEITPVNDEPISRDTTVTLAEDGSISLYLYGNDGDSMDNEADNQTLTWKIVSQPHFGNVTLNSTNGDLTYQPHLDFNGIDSLVYHVCDNGTSSGTPDPLCSEPSVVRFNVTPVNDITISQDTTVSLAEDGSITFHLYGNDGDPMDNEADNQALTWEILSPAYNGNIYVNSSNGSLTYLPYLNFNGTDSLVYRVCDNGTTNGAPDPLCSEPSVVRFNVTPVNDKPVSQDTTVILAEDGSITINLYGNDGDPMDNESDNQILTWEILTAPLSGVISTFDASTGNLIYQPNLNFNGYDSIVYRVCDNGTTNGVPDPLCSEPSVIQFRVRAVNDPPWITGFSGDKDRYSDFSGTAQIAFSIYTEDIEDTPITYQWYLNDSLINDSESTFLFSIPAGMNFLKCIATDGGDLNGELSDTSRISIDTTALIIVRSFSIDSQNEETVFTGDPYLYHAPITIKNDQFDASINTENDIFFSLPEESGLRFKFGPISSSSQKISTNPVFMSNNKIMKINVNENFDSNEVCTISGIVLEIPEDTKGIFNIYGSINHQDTVMTASSLPFRIGNPSFLSPEQYTPIPEASDSILINYIHTLQISSGDITGTFKAGDTLFCKINNSDSLYFAKPGISENAQIQIIGNDQDILQIILTRDYLSNEKLNIDSLQFLVKGAGKIDLELGYAIKKQEDIIYPVASETFLFSGRPQFDFRFSKKFIVGNMSEILPPIVIHDDKYVSVIKNNQIILDLPKSSGLDWISESSTIQILHNGADIFISSEIINDKKLEILHSAEISNGDSLIIMGLELSGIDSLCANQLVTGTIFNPETMRAIYGDAIGQKLFSTENFLGISQPKVKLEQKVVVVKGDAPRPVEYFYLYADSLHTVDVDTYLVTLPKKFPAKIFQADHITNEYRIEGLTDSSFSIILNEVLEAGDSLLIRGWKVGDVSTRYLAEDNINEYLSIKMKASSHQCFPWLERDLIGLNKLEAAEISFSSQVNNAFIVNDPNISFLFPPVIYDDPFNPIIDAISDTLALKLPDSFLGIWQPDIDFLSQNSYMQTYGLAEDKRVIWFTLKDDKSSEYPIQGLKLDSLTSLSPPSFIEILNGLNTEYITAIDSFTIRTGNPRIDLKYSRSYLAGDVSRVLPPIIIKEEHVPALTKAKGLKISFDDLNLSLKDTIIIQTSQSSDNILEKLDIDNCQIENRSLFLPLLRDFDANDSLIILLVAEEFQNSSENVGIGLSADGGDYYSSTSSENIAIGNPNYAQLRSMVYFAGQLQRLAPEFIYVENDVPVLNGANKLHFKIESDQSFQWHPSDRLDLFLNDQNLEANEYTYRVSDGILEIDLIDDLNAGDSLSIKGLLINLEEVIKSENNIQIAMTPISPIEMYYDELFFTMKDERNNINYSNAAIHLNNDERFTISQFDSASTVYLQPIQFVEDTLFSSLKADSKIILRLAESFPAIWNSGGSSNSGKIIFHSLSDDGKEIQFRVVTEITSGETIILDNVSIQLAQEVASPVPVQYSFDYDIADSSFYGYTHSFHNATNQSIQVGNLLFDLSYDAALISQNNKQFQCPDLFITESTIIPSLITGDTIQIILPDETDLFWNNLSFSNFRYHSTSSLPIENLMIFSINESRKELRIALKEDLFPGDSLILYGAYWQTGNNLQTPTHLNLSVISKANTWLRESDKTIRIGNPNINSVADHILIRNINPTAIDTLSTVEIIEAHGVAAISKRNGIFLILPEKSMLKWDESTLNNASFQNPVQNLSIIDDTTLHVNLQRDLMKNETLSFSNLMVKNILASVVNQRIRMVLDGDLSRYNREDSRNIKIGAPALILPDSLSYIVNDTAQYIHGIQVIEDSIVPIITKREGLHLKIGENLVPFLDKNTSIVTVRNGRNNEIQTVNIEYKEHDVLFINLIDDTEAGDTLFIDHIKLNNNTNTLFSRRLEYQIDNWSLSVKGKDVYSAESSTIFGVDQSMISTAAPSLLLAGSERSFSLPALTIANDRYGMSPPYSLSLVLPEDEPISWNQIPVIYAEGAGKRYIAAIPTYSPNKKVLTLSLTKAFQPGMEVSLIGLQVKVGAASEPSVFISLNHGLSYQDTLNNWLIIGEAEIFSENQLFHPKDKNNNRVLKPIRISQSNIPVINSTYGIDLRLPEFSQVTWDSNSVPSFMANSSVSNKISDYHFGENGKLLHLDVLNFEVNDTLIIQNAAVTNLAVSDSFFLTMHLDGPNNQMLIREKNSKAIINTELFEMDEMNYAIYDKGAYAVLPPIKYKNPIRNTLLESYSLIMELPQNIQFESIQDIEIEVNEDEVIYVENFLAQSSYLVLSDLLVEFWSYDSLCFKNISMKEINHPIHNRKMMYKLVFQGADPDTILLDGQFGLYAIEPIFQWDNTHIKINLSPAYSLPPLRFSAVESPFFSGDNNLIMQLNHALSNCFKLQMDSVLARNTGIGILSSQSDVLRLNIPENVHSIEGLQLIVEDTIYSDNFFGTNFFIDGLIDLSYQKKSMEPRRRPLYSYDSLLIYPQAILQSPAFFYHEQKPVFTFKSFRGLLPIEDQHNNRYLFWQIVTSDSTYTINHNIPWKSCSVSSDSIIMNGNNIHLDMFSYELPSEMILHYNAESDYLTRIRNTDFYSRFLINRSALIDQKGAIGEYDTAQVQLYFPPHTMVFNENDPYLSENEMTVSFSLNDELLNGSYDLKITDSNNNLVLSSQAIIDSKIISFSTDTLHEDIYKTQLKVKSPLGYDGFPKVFEFIVDRTPPEINFSLDLNKQSKDGLGHRFFTDEMITGTFTDNLRFSSDTLCLGKVKGFVPNFYFEDNLKYETIINWQLNSSIFIDTLLSYESNNFIINQSLDSLISGRLPREKREQWMAASEIPVQLIHNIYDQAGNKSTEEWKLVIERFQGDPLSDYIFNYPNPFNPVKGEKTNIRFTVFDDDSEGEFVVYNAAAQAVYYKKISAGILSRGQNEIIWDGRNFKGYTLASGVYLGIIKLDEQILRIKMVVLNQ